MKNQKKDKPLRANFAAFENVSYHLNATPLSVAVLAPCAWGKNLACSVSWQSVVNSAKQAQRIHCGKPLWAKQRTANSAWQVWRNGRCLRAKQCVATLQIQHGENGAVFGRGTSLSLSLSLLALFGKPLRSI